MLPVLVGIAASTTEPLTANMATTATTTGARPASHACRTSLGRMRGSVPRPWDGPPVRASRWTDYRPEGNGPRTHGAPPILRGQRQRRSGIGTGGEGEGPWDHPRGLFRAQRLAGEEGFEPSIP